MGFLNIFSNSNSSKHTSTSYRGMQIKEIENMILQYISKTHKNRLIKTVYHSTQQKGCYDYPSLIKFKIGNKQVNAKVSESILEFTKDFVKLKIHFDSKVAQVLDINYMVIAILFNPGFRKNYSLKIHIGKSEGYSSFGIISNGMFKYAYPNHVSLYKAHSSDKKYIPFETIDNLSLFGQNNNRLGNYEDYSNIIPKYLALFDTVNNIPVKAIQTVTILKTEPTPSVFQDQQLNIQKIDFNAAKLLDYLQSFYPQPNFDFSKFQEYSGFITSENCPKFISINSNNSAPIVSKISKAVLSFDPETEKHYASANLKLSFLNQGLKFDSISFTITHQEDYGIDLIVTLGKEGGQDCVYKIESSKEQLLNLPIKINLTFQKKSLYFAKSSLKQNPHYVYKKSLKNKVSVV